MEPENYFITMNYILDNEKIISNMVRVLISLETENDMKVNGLMVKNLVKEFLQINEMENFMDNLLMIKKMGLVSMLEEEKNINKFGLMINVLKNMK